MKVAVKSESVGEQQIEVMIVSRGSWERDVHLHQGSAPGYNHHRHHCCHSHHCHHRHHRHHHRRHNNYHQVVDTDGKTVLATLKAGSYFGEISILNMGTAGGDDGDAATIMVVMVMVMLMVMLKNLVRQSSNSLGEICGLLRPLCPLQD